jgi:nucleotide-binding universal stress UspA family protein
MTNSDLPTDRSEPARFILHPTDFSKNSDAALAHALRMALGNGANIDLLHVGKDTDEEWDEFPSIRQVLQNWGEIPEGASRSDVTDLGIGIEKVIAVQRSVVDAIEGYCQRRPIDMIVLSTAGRHGITSWIKPSTAEQIAETVSRISVPTLFVPNECRGCVDIDSGEVTMTHGLVPVDHQPESESAVERGLRAISMYGGDQADLTLLHIGSESRFPEVDIPDGPWQIKRVVGQGNPAAEILATAEKCQANLIIMVTEGSHGLLDVLRGTTTEQVLRQARCPVLAVPAQD